MVVLRLITCGTLIQILNPSKHMLSTKQLLRLACDLPGFLGVYALDRLPVRIPYPTCFIVNTDREAYPGQHWLAVYLDEGRRGEVFDSLARYDHLPTVLQRWMNLKSRWWTFNRRFAVQPWSSTLCGMYCLLYLVLRVSGQANSLYSATSKLTNPDYVLAWYKKYFN